MSQPVVDTLQLSDALRRTGMEREQAEGLARSLGEQLGAHVVAQGDLQTGFQELRGEIQSVDHRVDVARTELLGQIRVLDGKIDSVRTELAGEFRSLQTTLRIVGGGVGLLLAVVGFVAANAAFGTPTAAQWYAPPPEAVSAPAAGAAPSTPMP